VNTSTRNQQNEVEKNSIRNRKKNIECTTRGEERILSKNVPSKSSTSFLTSTTKIGDEAKTNQNISSSLCDNTKTVNKVNDCELEDRNKKDPIITSAKDLIIDYTDNKVR
jgi:hypothetical protein